ncbi:MAG TPA: NAD-dependent epimerase/dehydratase family protein [Methylomirabilota bacterium]|nr:NAD-dependent epimerase/dehydratase family protein [Methylomirabilota bacterium]
MQSVLVLGAAGRIGRAVAEAFRDAGWRVKGQVRPGGAGRLGAGIEPVEANGADAEALARAGADVDVVFHGLNPIYTRWKQDMTPLADAAIAAAAANRALLLLPGNVYNFGARMPERLTPDAPFRPTTSKGRLRVKLEDRIAAAAQRKGFKIGVLRAGDFFGGAGPGSWFDLVLAKDLAKDRFTRPAPPGLIHAWAYVPDLAAAFVRLAEARDRLGTVERFHFTGHAVTMEDMAAAVEAAVGRPLEVKALPWGMLRLVAVFMPMMRALLEMKYLWDVPHRLVDDRLEAFTGPLPATPLNRAVAEALAAMTVD